MELKRTLFPFLSTAFLIAASFVVSSCSKPEAPLLSSLSGFSEEYPAIDLPWLERLLLEEEANGVFVVDNAGQLRTQVLGGQLTPPIKTSLLNEENVSWAKEQDFSSQEVVAQMVLPLVLLEEGTTYKELSEALTLSSHLRGTASVGLAMWNSNLLVTQVTSPRVSHSANYPEYGLILQVEMSGTSSGDLHFRWGNPSGQVSGSTRGPIHEEPYEWTEVETLENLIMQLRGKFKLDKTIHLKPSDEQSVGPILAIVDQLHRAGFLYVELCY